MIDPPPAATMWDQTVRVTKYSRSTAAMRGLAIKSKQAGNRTDPGDLTRGKSGCHRAAGWLEVTCRRKTSAARSASWSLVET
jgi:hypothetical protein